MADRLLDPLQPREDHLLELLDGADVGEEVCQALRAALQGIEPGSRVQDSHHLGAFLSGLERVLPAALERDHEAWQGEDLDAVLPEAVRKTGPHEVEIVGLVVLLSDQSLLAVHLRLAIHAEVDEIAWLDCRLGERDGQSVVCIPWEARGARGV